ncbi:response regulator transcription factor [Breznakiella homolactica]|uniref:Response regulator transcription factor n=1 Tax=Breznakiella homolactica TaxID=2798577 RepID=A0A7T7XQM3_9SPIR|nr:response regulator transcription factor [Breznakiella homolactica]QQO10696.1 response regulator transcription factor [Breznakiella homolactica]
MNKTENNNTAASKIRILLADDQLLFSENLKLMLETLADDIQVVGVARDGQEAIEMIEGTDPNLILMDVRMPRLDGVEATKTIHQMYPDIRIVMLTTFLDDTYVQDALNYGAYGYILKNIHPEDLIASIRAISRGAVLFSQDILTKLTRRMDSDTPGDESDKEYQEIVNKLGKREKDILKLVAKGYNNSKIAETLFISKPTVRNYISSIYAKVGSKDRLQVISIAQKVKLENQ